MEVYLDNAATTRCSDAAAEIMKEVLTKDYGNPSAMHHMGVVAEKYVTQARKTIAKSLKVKDKEIYFTSGGTESNNLAIKGVLAANKRAGKHIITTEVEHPSVYNVFKELETKGYSVTYLPVDKDGLVSVSAVLGAVRDDTSLVSIMHVNNEVGAVEPVSELSKMIKGNNSNVIFHVDAIQSYGKLPLLPERSGIDMLSVSGHKIHGPKGSGFIYISDKVKVSPEHLGGGQERGMRSGTENVPAIAGLGEAVREIFEDEAAYRSTLRSLKEELINALRDIDGVILNGRTDASSAPHILSVTVPGVRSEVLLHALEDAGIYVSAGSACSSNHPAPSRTLTAMGLSPQNVESTIRISLSRYNTSEDISYAAAAMRKIIPQLKKFVRR
ncbi:MAG: cysteine desulfurase [Lachnospiraceae bacterium]|nr:cysteine desulfurase [Lachnospiraceae bacterium]